MSVPRVCVWRVGRPRPARGGKKPWPWGGRFGCRRARRPAGTPTPICVTRFWCRSLAAAKASFSNEVVLDTKSFLFVSFLNEAFIVDLARSTVFCPPPLKKSPCTWSRLCRLPWLVFVLMHEEWSKPSLFIGQLCIVLNIHYLKTIFRVDSSFDIFVSNVQGLVCGPRREKCCIVVVGVIITLEFYLKQCIIFVDYLVVTTFSVIVHATLGQQQFYDRMVWS